MKASLKKKMSTALSLALFVCPILSACAAKTASSPGMPSPSEEKQMVSTNSSQATSDMPTSGNCLPSGPSEIQPQYWEMDEFEAWMNQQHEQIQKLADNQDKSFYYKDANGTYVCREWTQDDVDSLFKRNRNAFFVQPGIQRKSVIFIQSPLFYIFIHIAFFASCARLCIQFPALRCAENVQKCAEGKSVPFHSVPAGVKTIGQMEQPPSACQSAAGGCSPPLSQVTYSCATRRPCQGSS